MSARGPAPAGLLWSPRRLPGGHLHHVGAAWLPPDGKSVVFAATAEGENLRYYLQPVDGGPPPDGRPVRYFRVEQKFMESGWMVIGETDSYRYYSEMMP